jgi:pimeloyl-ACP methyl ester carboxylesterase
MRRTNVKHSKVTNGNVTLPISESGQGPTLLFFNGAGTTQAAWKRTIRELGGPYRLVTFDFRNHGTATRSPDISFERFLSDAEAVMDQVAGPRPIVVGWSLGADLAVWYAAAHPGRVAGLFLIDGAVPVNLVTDPDDLRRRLNTPAVWYSPWLMYLVGMGYRLTPSEMATLTIEVNTRRQQLLSAYNELDCPVELVLATKTARDKGASAERKNALWRAGGEQLARLYPAFSLQWVDNTHLLPFTEPTRLAQSLDAFVQRIQASSPILMGDPRLSQPDPELKTQQREGDE